MENKKNKGAERFRKVLIFLSIVFICLYSISLNGYNNKEYKKTLYTEEQIRRFESDVMNGKKIDINDYLNYDDIDYSNKYSKWGEKLSKVIDYVANKSIDALISFFSVFFK